MPKLAEVCRYVRSKNAGPFWLTIDLFFQDREAYQRHRAAPALETVAVAALYGADPALVRRFEVDDLCVIKLSIPRPTPQGGVVERDMHGGQQYAPLLALELE